MKISFNGELIDFESFHSISINETTIIFHGKYFDKKIILNGETEDTIDDVCCDIVSQYRKSKALMHLEQSIAYCRH